MSTLSYTYGFPSYFLKRAKHNFSSCKKSVLRVLCYSLGTSVVIFWQCLYILIQLAYLNFTLKALLSQHDGDGITSSHHPSSQPGCSMPMRVGKNTYIQVGILVASFQIMENSVFSPLQRKGISPKLNKYIHFKRLQQFHNIIINGKKNDNPLNAKNSMVQDSKIRPACLNHLMFAIIHDLQQSL